MLPLLTKLIPQTAVSLDCLSLAFGRGQLQSVLTRRTDKGTELRRIQQHPLASSLFTTKPGSSARTEITTALIAASKTLDDPFTTIHICLPDPVIVMQVFMLDSIPHDQAAQRELALWRFSRDQHLPKDEIDCSCQVLGEDDGKQLLLGLAIEKSWLSIIKTAINDAGLLPAVIDAAACYRFNYFHDVLTKTKKHGALLTLEPDYWSLSIWDDRGRLRFNRARWREPETDKLVSDLAAEIERSIRAWLHGKSYQFGGIYLVGQDAAFQPLAEILTNRMQQAPVILTSDQGVVDNKKMISADVSCSAIAASVLR